MVLQVVQIFWQQQGNPKSKQVTCVSHMEMVQLTLDNRCE
jgi:hypothetical protein